MNFIGKFPNGLNQLSQSAIAITVDGIDQAIITTTSFTINDPITGSLFGTASYVTGSIFTNGNSARSASYALTSSYALSSSLAATASFARYPIITRTITSATTAGAATNTDFVFLINGTATLTLPTSVGNTSTYHVKNIGTGTATITSSVSPAGQTIEGSTGPVALPVQYTSVTFIASASNWFII